MSITTQTIFVEALSLPQEARAERARRLLVSLEDVDFSDDVSEAWRGEIESRQDFSEGNAQGVSAEEALRRAEAALG